MRRTTLSLTIFAFLTLLAINGLAVTGQIDSLDNGMRMILVENHGSPMIASVIFVASGSKYESEYENGITHFLEHLLFNGTTNLSREDLDASISDLGGYINAFTRKDLTAYLVLLPAQYIEHGLTVQADMLFNSVIPEEELEKERKVVIEEIRQSADAPGAPADDFFTAMAYGHTEYGRPVLGYEALIANIPREAIVKYWKENYTPDKMTALVIGDFQTDAMRKTMNTIFGSIPVSEREITEKASSLHQRLANAKGRPDQMIGGRRYDTVADVRSTYINFAIAGPDFGSADYLAFDLLSQYLALDEISPLKTALQSGAEPLATEVSVSLVARPEFTRLEISAITEEPQLRDSVVATVLASLQALPTHTADSVDLAGIKTTNRCEAIYYAEKLHYYGFIIAPMMMTGGWEWLQTYPDRLDSVSWEQCQTVATTWLSEPNYIATTVRPADSVQTGFEATGPDGADVVTHFGTIEYDSALSSPGVELVYPSLDSVSLELVDNAVYHREVLENGLTVIVKSSQDSRVFAVNLLGRNRTANETEGRYGITDFVNRCLEKGTVNRDAAQLQRDLSSIGANLTLADNPWIPYDDRYTTRQFAFIKFETIESFAAKGFELLTELVTQPAFDSIEVESVRSEMLGILGRDSGSTSKAARDLFYESVFPEHPFSHPIMGDPQTVGRLTREALRTHHACFYSPQNLIISIVASRDTSEVMNWVRTGWGQLENNCKLAASPPVPTPAASASAAHRSIDKEQIAIRVGGRLPGINSDETLDLQVAAAILSNRLFSSLREKQGLAYSTGAGTGFDHNFGWYYLAISTGSENYARAREGLALQTDKLAYDGPTEAEVSRAANQIWGRLMSSRLSRINQAYYLGLNELYGRPIAWNSELLDHLSQITPGSVRKVASKYFRTDLWIEATAGTKP